MDFPSSDLLFDLLYFVCVAVPVGIIVSASETPGKSDRRMLLVLLVAASFGAVGGWPLAALWGIESGAGLAIITSVMASGGGYWISRQIRRDPALEEPEFAAKAIIFIFAGVAVVGSSWIVLDDPDLGAIVVGMSLIGVALGAVDLARSRRTTSES